MNEDLKIIKKKYGEKMMKLCRESFPTLLESEGLLSQLMLEHFDPSHVLYEDMIYMNVVRKKKYKALENIIKQMKCYVLLRKID